MRKRLEGRDLNNCNVIVTTYRRQIHGGWGKDSGDRPKPTPMNRRSLLPRFARGAFTLVEILTVMAIVSVLLAVTAPALKGINGVGGRKAAVRTIMGTLDQARMMAISDGRATYVVFAGRNLVGTKCDSMIGRAYAVYQDDVNFTPVQRSAWVYLPVGVAFKMASDFDTLINRDLGTSDPSFTVHVPKGGNDSPTTVQLPYVKFDPTGAVDGTLANDSVPQHFRILVFPGLVSNSGSETLTRAARTENGGGTMSGNLLLDEIRLNPATGRVRYILNPADNLPPKSS